MPVDDLIKEWYCMRGDRVEGPYTLQDLRHLLDSGSLVGTDMVRRGEGGAWAAVRSVLEGLEERRSAPPPPTATLLAPTREQEPRVGLEAPFSEWGVSALVMGSVFLIVTPLSYSIAHQISDAGGNRFFSFLLTFVLQILLFAGNGASVAFGVLGVLDYAKQRQRLPLSLAGAVVSALSMLLWLLSAIVMVRHMDR
jgi:hypothetical protein